MPAPHRRHRFTLDLEADTLEELIGSLHYLADEIEAEAKANRQLRYQGQSATFDAELRTDEDQDAQRYRAQLGEWRRDEGQGTQASPRVCDSGV